LRADLDPLFEFRLLVLELGQLLGERLDEEPRDGRRVLGREVDVLVDVVLVVLVISLVNTVLKSKPSSSFKVPDFT
jgi:hypothetical protein